MSDSSIALKPVIDEPSKPMPSSSAPSDLADRDREALQMPLEIGEPEKHVVDARLLDRREHPLAGRRVRRRSILALDLRHGFLLARRPTRSLFRARRDTLAVWSRAFLARTADAVSRRRRAVVAVWLVLLAGGGWFALHQADHLSGGGWDVPGSPSLRVSALLDRFPGSRRRRSWCSSPARTQPRSHLRLDAIAPIARGRPGAAARATAIPRGRPRGAPARALRGGTSALDRRGDEATAPARADDATRPDP